MTDTEYKAAGGAEDTRIEMGTDPDKKKPEDHGGGICAPFRWFLAKPWSRYPFAIFIMFGFLTIIWLIMFLTAPTSGFVMAGIAAVVMSLYGANHFRTLLGLKEQVDRMAGLNQDFRNENAALKTEVDKLTKARQQLTDVQAGLVESNRKLKENVEKFRQLDANLKKLSDSNIDGLEKLQQSSDQVMKSMKESLVRHEKEILNKVFDHFEMNDDQTGLNAEEFDQFLNALPQSYRKRFEQQGKSFEQLAGDDKIIDFKEFRIMVDYFAEQEAEAGGSI